MEKDYVGMQVCIVCHEPISILLDKKLKKRIPKKVVTDIEPCENCRKKYLKKGVMIVREDMESLIILKESGFKRMTKMEIPERRILLMKEDDFENVFGEHIRKKGEKNGK